MEVSAPNTNLTHVQDLVESKVENFAELKESALPNRGFKGRHICKNSKIGDFLERNKHGSTLGSLVRLPDNPFQ